MRGTLARWNLGRLQWVGRGRAVSSVKMVSAVAELPRLPLSAHRDRYERHKMLVGTLHRTTLLVLHSEVLPIRKSEHNSLVRPMHVYVSVIEGKVNSSSPCTVQ